MMGSLSDSQSALFYEFSLEAHVPADHLLRQIDACLDLDGLRAHLADHYSHTGRPSIDPELMVRMLIVGYCYGIRSERRLCDEVHLNLAYRWFCRLGLDGAVPSHSTFSKNRHGRFRDNGTLRWVFDQVVDRCMQAGLVKGEGFAVDASLIPADASRQRGVPGAEPIDWGVPEKRSRAVREYLEALDDSAAPEARKSVSLSDPQSQWTAATGGPAFFSYSTNYLIDIEHGVILDVEATPSNRIAEVESTKTMVDRVETRCGIQPKKLVADTAYGNAKMLSWLVDDKGIEPHIPVWEKHQRTDGSIPSSDFVWDGEANEYRCPQGKALIPGRRQFSKPRTGITKAGTVLYRSSTYDCRVCPLKQQCCPSTPTRKIARSIHEDARNVAREIAKSDEYRRSRCERKKVEMRFAHLKRILGLERLRLRGLSGAADEFVMAATTQNLRRMAKLVARPPPEHRIGAPG
ncbi:MAG: IS1182 family transposase [Abyssibacter sp.]|uniref:IS1182 family transposase n=1 Tax=Abyssibacter sp. TaxID=2320200 RepID=UPI00321C0FA7